MQDLCLTRLCITGQICGRNDRVHDMEEILCRHAQAARSDVGVRYSKSIHTRCSTVEWLLDFQLLRLPPPLILSTRQLLQYKHTVSRAKAQVAPNFEIVTQSAAAVHDCQVRLPAEEGRPVCCATSLPRSIHHGMEGFAALGR